MMFQQQMMAMQADNQASMQNQLNKKTWNLLFDVHNYGRVINIKIDPDKTCKEAIDMFKLKIGFDDNFRFIFNNKILIPEMKINQSELKDFSKILVITSSFTYKAKGNPIVVTFKIRQPDKKESIPILMQCGSDDTVSDTINRYRGYSNDCETDKSFIFNEKPLKLSLTLSESGIGDKSIIYVIPFKKVKNNK